MTTSVLTRMYYTTRDEVPASTTPAMWVAMKLVLKYQHRTPTPRELMSQYGMSRATAYRWIAAFKAAKGEA